MHRYQDAISMFDDLRVHIKQQVFLIERHESQQTLITTMPVSNCTSVAVCNAQVLCSMFNVCQNVHKGAEYCMHPSGHVQLVAFLHSFTYSSTAANAMLQCA